MAVEFYPADDKNQKNFLFQLTDSDFEKLQDVLVEYKKRTGLTIDRYKTTRIHEGHVKLLVELTEKILANIHRPDLQLIQIKEKFKGNIKDLIAVGD